MKHNSCYKDVDIGETLNPRFVRIELMGFRDRGHVVQVDLDLI
jgi:hypothetical protein